MNMFRVIQKFRIYLRRAAQQRKATGLALLPGRKGMHFGLSNMSDHNPSQQAELPLPEEQQRQLLYPPGARNDSDHMGLTQREAGISPYLGHGVPPAVRIDGANQTLAVIGQESASTQPEHIQGNQAQGPSSEEWVDDVFKGTSFTELLTGAFPYEDLVMVKLPNQCFSSCSISYHCVEGVSSMSTMSLRPSGRTEVCRRQYKVAVDAEEGWSDGPPSMVSGVCSDNGSHGGGAALVIRVIATTTVMMAATVRVVVTAVGDNVRVVSVMCSRGYCSKNLQLHGVPGLTWRMQAIISNGGHVCRNRGKDSTQSKKDRDILIF
ncbi:hypothetical protein Ancab_008848 [Ancistrocladus abbreviatus]